MATGKRSISFNYLLAFCVLAICLLLGAASKPAVKKSRQPNVLFIFVDDLRPDLGCYGHKQVKSPHLDRLAAQGQVFRRHYVQVPTCGASRFSLLTGKLPQARLDLSNNVIELRRKQNLIHPGPESFVEQLRRNGYYTVGMGKISHSPDGYIYPYLGEKSTDKELPQSWDEMLLNPGKWGTGWNAFFAYADGSNRNTLQGQVKPYEAARVADESYPDALTAALAVQKMQELANRTQPFFLGVGFFKPHLPFNAPQKYWDLYAPEQIPLTPSPALPGQVHPASLHNSNEFNSYRLGDEKPSLAHPVSAAYEQKLKQGYYAAISYVDAQIGKVLSELSRLGLADNTIVVVWGDHGWHLGDHRVWGKHTLREAALRSALIIKAPGVTPKQSVNDNIVSSIDIYPTLMELCGLQAPAGIQGKSLVPLMRHPRKIRPDQVAYSYFNNGISLRTNQYRLTQYFREAQPTIELYDHLQDEHENRNIAPNHPDVVRRLLPIWEKGNTGLFAPAGPGKE